MFDSQDLIEVAALIYARVHPLLEDPHQLGSVGVVTNVKSEGHTAHRIDDIADEALMEGLVRMGFDGRVFSEESGWTTLGTSDATIVCDPFCNTTPTFRGIREAAIALTSWRQGALIACALVDLQVARVAVVRDRVVEVRSLPFGQGSKPLVLTHPVPTSLDQAHVVWSLYKRRRRAEVPRALLAVPATLQVLDGAINAVRLLAGDADVFVDLLGQPLYEALPYAAVALNGGAVLDLSGNPVDFRAILNALASGGSSGRVPLVAARSELLARQVIGLVSDR